MVDLGTGTSFDIKALAPGVDYSQLTVDNFISETNSGSTPDRSTEVKCGSSCAYGVFSLIKTYNATTGILSSYMQTRTWAYKADWSGNGVTSVHVYLVY
ncbi:hypothetical protein IJ098_02315 [Candidatus Saccharibacteria bacterium]|nr:hypothetical protein [Candidatus Saccharibacteria bacterium]